MKKLHLSLHDLAPHHLDRAKKVEELFVKLGVTQAAYFLVPDFHRKGESKKVQAFVDWCHEKRPFSVEWVLHGYYHLDEPQAGEELKVWDRLRRNFLTASEGEFLPLKRAEISKRLDAGLAAFAELFQGKKPKAFVAPAWLYNQDLYPALRERQIPYTENHRFVIDVIRQQKIACPAISWSTRKWSWRAGSLIVCPQFLRLWKSKNSLRIAIHPHDFDYSSVKQSIEKVLSSALTNRRTVSYAEL